MGWLKIVKAFSRLSQTQLSFSPPYFHIIFRTCYLPDELYFFVCNVRCLKNIINHSPLIYKTGLDTDFLLSLPCFSFLQYYYYFYPVHYIIPVLISPVLCRTQDFKNGDETDLKTLWTWVTS